MAGLDSREIERRGVQHAANLIAISARTAPKASAVDNIVTTVLDSAEDLETVAQAMEKHCEQKKVRIESFIRDADNLRRSLAVVLIGVKGTMPKTPERPLNCGACGYKDCKAYMKASKQKGEDFLGPLCVFNTMDLGIALGSAVKTAADLNIDNRMMYTIGAAVKDMGFLDADIIIGIPLSVSGKNVFFDRAESPKVQEEKGSERDA
jgi:uncharacterized ferredoxin-like protein